MSAFEMSELLESGYVLYPGSAFDFTPVLLDLPDNPTGVRLRSLDEPHGATLVMIDNKNLFVDAMIEGPRAVDATFPPANYAELWRRLGLSAEVQEIARPAEADVAAGERAFVLQVRVAPTKSAAREPATYVVVFLAMPDDAAYKSLSERGLRNCRGVVLCRQGFVQTTIDYSARGLAALVEIGLPAPAFVVSDCLLNWPGYTPTGNSLKDWGYAVTSLWRRELPRVREGHLDRENFPDFGD